MSFTVMPADLPLAMDFTCSDCQYAVGMVKKNCIGKDFDKVKATRSSKATVKGSLRGSNKRITQELTNMLLSPIILLSSHRV